MWCKGNLHSRVLECRKRLEDAQTDLDSDPYSIIFHENERNALKDFNDAVLDEECFLKQKSKVEWLRVGDSNSSYFHKVVKGRINRGRINAVVDASGNFVEGATAKNACVHHYEEFLGKAMQCDEIINPVSLFSRMVSEQKSAEMIRPVTPQEIKDAIFDIGDAKSPSPDGYSSSLFKKSWDIIGDDVIKVVQQFFINGQLLTKLNSTIIALVPKVLSPCKRGLRQGDPMSPYLFTLAMEVLLLILKRNIRKSRSFRYHPKCAKLEIVNLCFADDLFIFAHADVASVGLIRDSLEEFKKCSGLVLSMPKSTVSFRM
ncbi:uncharacterized protein [Rutidosis leptorrhynchoides]|uniref:uncharacterized protein n=1 Tax=Rutidosis leptorrhynchoides TaxID=125765 RepID=UPI003A99ADA3